MRTKCTSFASTMVLLFTLCMAGCTAHTHIVGTGGTTGEVVEERQWYILWGLVPINDVDSNAMAAGAENYTIETEQSALDVIINIFTGVITVNSRTVTVTR